MQHELQKCWNVSDVICDPLSETNVSGRRCWLNSHLRTAIVERVSVFCIGKISGNLEWAKTITKKAKAMESKANKYPEPWLLWSFRSKNRCSRWFKCQCSFSLSAASEVIREDWGKTLDDVIGLVRNGTLSWGSENCITNRIERYVQMIQWLDKIKTQ